MTNACKKIITLLKRSGSLEDKDPHDVVDIIKERSSKNGKYTLLGDYLNQTLREEINIKIEACIKWALFFFEYPGRPFGLYENNPMRARNWLSILNKDQVYVDRIFNSAFLKNFNKIKRTYVPSVLQYKLGTTKYSYLRKRPWIVWATLTKNNRDIKNFCPKRMLVDCNFKLACIVPHHTLNTVSICECQTYKNEEPSQISNLYELLNEKPEEVYSKITGLHKVIPLGRDNEEEKFQFYLRLPIIELYKRQFIAEAHIALNKDLSILNFLSPLQIALYKIVALINNQVAYFIGNRLGEQKTATLSSKKTLTILESRKELIGTKTYKEFVLKTIQQVNHYKDNVILEGERGSGKRFISDMITKEDTNKQSQMLFKCYDRNSLRAIISPNHDVISSSTAKSIFRRKCLFDDIKSATLIIEKIDKIPIEEQNHLLDKFNKFPESNIRIIGTTTKNFREKIELGAFSNKLYLKIEPTIINCHSLRENRSNVFEYVEHFMNFFSLKYNKTIKKVSPEAYDLLYNYNWPGNITELKDTISVAVMLAEGEILTAGDVGFLDLKNIKIDSHNFACTFTGVKITRETALSAKLVVDEIFSKRRKKIKPAYLFPGGELFKKKAIENNIERTPEFAFSFFCLIFANHWEKRGNRQKNLEILRFFFDVKAVDTVWQKFYKVLRRLMDINGFQRQETKISIILSKCCVPFNTWFNKNCV